MDDQPVQYSVSDDQHNLFFFQECGDNQSQFPRSITRGPGEGFWWAFVTMTTVG